VTAEGVTVVKVIILRLDLVGPTDQPLEERHQAACFDVQETLLRRQIGCHEGSFKPHHEPFSLVDRMRRLSNQASRSALR
jgi:hypothetical protein